MSKEYTIGSGNVFADLDIPNAAEELVKSDLAIEIATTIRKRDLTQEQAAAIIGIDQSRVAQLMRGDLDTYSIDMLLRLLTLLNRNVTIVVEAEQADHPGSLRVLAG